MKTVVGAPMTGTGNLERSRKGVLGAAARLVLALLGLVFSVSSPADTICASAQIQGDR